MAARIDGRKPVECEESGSDFFCAIGSKLADSPAAVSEGLVGRAVATAELGQNGGAKARSGSFVVSRLLSLSTGARPTLHQIFPHL